MDNATVRTAPETAQELAGELNGAHDQPSLKKAIQDTYDAHETSSQTDWNTMSQILKNSVSLTQIGLGDFELTGVDQSSTGNPEITMVKKDGSETIAIDDTGYSQTTSAGDSSTAPASASSTDAPVTPSAPVQPSADLTPTPASDAPVTPPAPVQPSADVTSTPATDAPVTPPAPVQPSADVTPAPATDAPVKPDATAPTDSAAPKALPASDTASSTSGDAGTTEDPSTGVAPDGSFGQNGRKMTLSSDGTQGTYTVQPGDSLWTIAEDKLGVGDAANDPEFQTRVANLVAQLTSDNNISDPDLIYPGQQLTFTNLQNSAYDPSSYDAASATSPTTAASATDAPSQPPPVNVAPTSSDSGQDGSSTDYAPAGQTPAQDYSAASQAGSNLIAQSPNGSYSTADVTNYNTLPLPPQDLTPLPTQPDAGTMNGSGSGDD